MDISGGHKISSDFVQNALEATKNRKKNCILSIIVECPKGITVKVKGTSPFLRFVEKKYIKNEYPLQ